MNETVGKQLRQAREARKISLEQVAQATHIRLHYLQAIEAGKFDALPSQAQGRGFLRAYASYVGLNPDEVLASFTGETTTEPPPQDPARSASQSDGDTYQAEAIFNELDCEGVAKAALTETDFEKQVAAAYQEIENQIREKNLLLSVEG